MMMDIESNATPNSSQTPPTQTTREEGMETSEPAQATGGETPSTNAPQEDPLPSSNG